MDNKEIIDEFYGATDILTPVKDRMEYLMSKSCWVIDVFPDRVPEEEAASYAKVEKQLLHTEELNRKKYNVIMKIMQHYKFRKVLCDGEKIKEVTPEKLSEIVGRRYVRILLNSALIDSDPDDMHILIYNPTDKLIPIARKIAESEGLYLWLAKR